MRLHEEFELTPYTMSVIPIPYGSKTYSKIMELDNEFITPYRPVDIIKKSCRFYASSYAGRKEGTKELIGVSIKAPIVIDPLQSIYFFPTASSSKLHCAWISPEHVLSYERIDGITTEVVFRNKQRIRLQVSSNTFKNQMYKTAMLQTKMLQRSAENGRKNLFSTESELFQEAKEKRKVYRVTRRDWSDD
ncbi:competence protein ComK [Caldibacillus lycopersici]|uniref:Competence protein ComK n=1 Tax=Perspicuibacillus lycopersici TaxID=1325689 RepID=A0AAE3IQ24_9BACI|nr:competence protein ComK [Perspicuibacillus lycopersici]MCU9612485.1 competence protein ComK [Perspicuibacillus lycopersici]